MTTDIHALAVALGHRHTEIRIRRVGLADNAMGWCASLIAESQTTGPAIAAASAKTPELAYEQLVRDVFDMLEAQVRMLEDRAKAHRSVLTGSKSSDG